MTASNEIDTVYVPCVCNESGILKWVNRMVTRESSINSVELCTTHSTPRSVAAETVAGLVETVLISWSKRLHQGGCGHRSSRFPERKACEQGQKCAQSSVGFGEEVEFVCTPVRRIDLSKQTMDPSRGQCGGSGRRPPCWTVLVTVEAGGSVLTIVTPAWGSKLCPETRPACEPEFQHYPLTSV